MIREIKRYIDDANREVWELRDLVSDDSSYIGVCTITLNRSDGKQARVPIQFKLDAEDATSAFDLFEEAERLARIDAMEQLNKPKIVAPVPGNGRRLLIP